jgi:hypothetical protein
MHPGASQSNFFSLNHLGLHLAIETICKGNSSFASFALIADIFAKYDVYSIIDLLFE